MKWASFFWFPTFLLIKFIMHRWDFICSNSALEDLTINTFSNFRKSRGKLQCGHNSSRRHCKYYSRTVCHCWGQVLFPIFQSNFKWYNSKKIICWGKIVLPHHLDLIYKVTKLLTLDMTIFGLKMMVKSCLEKIILKLNEPF